MPCGVAQVELGPSGATGFYRIIGRREENVNPIFAIHGGKSRSDTNLRQSHPLTPGGRGSSRHMSPIVAASRLQALAHLRGPHAGLRDCAPTAARTGTAPRCWAGSRLKRCSRTGLKLAGKYDTIHLYTIERRGRIPFSAPPRETKYLGSRGGAETRRGKVKGGGMKAKGRRVKAEGERRRLPGLRKPRLWGDRPCNFGQKSVQVEHVPRKAYNFTFAGRIANASRNTGYRLVDQRKFRAGYGGVRRVKGLGTRVEGRVAAFILQFAFFILQFAFRLPKILEDRRASR
jgi:hypothetical protein